MGKLYKYDIEFEHVDEKKEKVRMSSPLALAVLERVLKPGWPFLTPIIDGKRLKCKDGNCVNAFITEDGERIVL
jgi:hypothetical protein